MFGTKISDTTKVIFFILVLFAFTLYFVFRKIVYVIDPLPNPSIPIVPIDPSIPIDPIDPSVPVDPIDPSIPINPITPSKPIVNTECRKATKDRSCKNLGMNVLGREEMVVPVICPPGYGLNHTRAKKPRCYGNRKTTINPSLYKVCGKAWPNRTKPDRSKWCNIGGVSTSGEYGLCRIGPNNTYWVTNPVPYNYFCGKL